MLTRKIKKGVRRKCENQRMTTYIYKIQDKNASVIFLT